MSSNAEKNSFSSQKIKKTDKETELFDGDKEISKTSLTLEEDSKLFKLSVAYSDTDEVVRNKDVPETDMKNGDKKPALQDQGKKLEFRDNIGDKPLQKVQPQLGLVEQSELTKFLYGLSDVTKPRKTEFDKYSSITEEIYTISDEENASDPEIARKAKDSESGITKPLDKISNKKKTSSSEIVEKADDFTSYSLRQKSQLFLVEQSDFMKLLHSLPDITKSQKTEFVDYSQVIGEVDEISEGEKSSEPEIAGKLDYSQSKLTKTLDKILDEKKTSSSKIAEKTDDFTSYSLSQKTHSSLVVQSDPMQLLHGLRDVTKPNKTDYSPITEKADEILDEKDTRNFIPVDKPDIFTSYSLKTPLEEILTGCEYEERADVWKALDNLHEERKRKHKCLLGLDEENIKYWQNEKLREELYENKLYTPSTILTLDKKHAVLEKHLEICTDALDDEGNIKASKTHSETDLSGYESKSDILKNIYIKKPLGYVSISTPNIPLCFLYNLDSPDMKKEKFSQSLIQGKSFNYLSPKGSEYFGYLAQMFDENVLFQKKHDGKVSIRKQTEKFLEFVVADKKHFIQPSIVNVEPAYITDVSKGTESLQPINRVSNIQNNREVKYTDSLNSHYKIETQVEKNQKPAVTTNSNTHVDHKDFNSYFLNPNIDDMHLPSIISEERGKKYAPEQENEESPQMEPKFQKTQTETTTKAQQREIENTKFCNFDVQQNSKPFLMTPPNDIEIKNMDDHDTCIQIKKEIKLTEVEKAHRIFVPIKREVISHITVHKEYLEQATHIPSYEFCKFITSNGTQNKESTFPATDITKVGAKADLNTYSHYESQEDISTSNIPPTQFESRFSSESRKSPEVQFGKHSEELDLNSDISVDHVEENLSRIHISAYDKTLRMNTQFLRDTNNAEIDFRNPNHIDISFKFPTSLIDSNITNKQKSSCLTQIEPEEENYENGSKKGTSGIQRKESNILISSTEADILSKDTDKEIYKGESDSYNVVSSSLVSEIINPFEQSSHRSHNIQQPIYTSNKNSDIEIMEGVEIFPEYQVKDQDFNGTSLTEREKQSTDSSENNVYQNFDSYRNQVEDSETKVTSRINYLCAEQNSQVMNIANKRAENIENYFKTNKIRTTNANSDEIVIIDDMEDEIAIFEEEMSSLYL